MNSRGKSLYQRIDASISKLPKPIRAVLTFGAGIMLTIGFPVGAMVGLVMLATR